MTSNAPRAALRRFPWFSDEGAPLHAGEALLVSVDGQGGEGSGLLWCLCPEQLKRSPLPSAPAQLEPSAQLALGRAMLLARTTFPGLTHPGRGFPDWIVHRLPTRPTVGMSLTGESYGLAMALAAVSYLVEVAVDRHLVALAALAHDGALLPVGGLQEKLRVVADAPAIRRVVVAKDQEEEARGYLRTLRTLELVAYSTLDEVVSGQFADVAQVATLDAERVADGLFAQVVDGRLRTALWARVRGILGQLRGRLTPGSLALEKVSLAFDVVRRHDGEKAILQPSVALSESLRRPRRLSLAAQVVQSWSDSGASEVEVDAAARHALSLVSPHRERTEADAKLLGAVGRAFAAAGDYVRARDILEEAWTDWEDFGQLGEASHPACELARLARFAPDPVAEGHRVAMHRVRPVLEASDLAPSSRPFLQLALGQAWAAARDWNKADVALVSAHDDLMVPPGARAAALRWLSRVACAEGAVDRAAHALALVDTLPADQRRKTLAFVALDRALAAGDAAAIATALAEVEAWVRETPREAHEAERLFRRAADRPGDRARIIAEEYRY